jgi:predicted 3-demethylubiquinone-9 3-methyltransferase (glyoxalase superfamily)
MQKITTFLMFEGQAEEAMKFYTSAFKDSKIDSIVRYGAEQKGMEGKVVHGEFTLAGQQFIAMDNASGNSFSFTPSFSLYVECQTGSEIDALYKKLSQGGFVMMEFKAYPFSPKYSWFTDKYGVSWQIFLAKSQ